jgi:multiple sugar transport system permease protein
VIIYPLLIILQGSFHPSRFLKFKYTTPLSLVNYGQFFAEWQFIKPLGVTLLYTVSVSFLSFLIGLVLALLLNQNFMGRSTARILFISPWPIPASIAALIGMLMVDPTVGVLNAFLMKVGVLSKPMAMLSFPLPAFVSVSLVTIWKGFPFFTIILLAGLQSIPEYLYEAASIDGARWFIKFRHITLPGLRSIIAIGFLLQGLWTLRDFSIIYVMTQGGPVGWTETLALHLYNYAFSFYNMGYAAAVGVVVLLISLILAIVVLRFSSERSKE